MYKTFCVPLLTGFTLLSELSRNATVISLPVNSKDGARVVGHIQQSVVALPVGVCGGWEQGKEAGQCLHRN